MTESSSCQRDHMALYRKCLLTPALHKYVSHQYIGWGYKHMSCPGFRWDRLPSLWVGVFRFLKQEALVSPLLFPLPSIQPPNLPQLWLLLLPLPKKYKTWLRARGVIAHSFIHCLLYFPLDIWNLIEKTSHKKKKKRKDIPLRRQVRLDHRKYKASERLISEKIAMEVWKLHPCSAVHFPLLFLQP